MCYLSGRGCTGGGEGLRSWRQRTVPLRLSAAKFSRREGACVRVMGVRRRRSKIHDPHCHKNQPCFLHCRTEPPPVAQGALQATARAARRGAGGTGERGGEPTGTDGNRRELKVMLVARIIWHTLYNPLMLRSVRVAVLLYLDRPVAEQRLHGHHKVGRKVVFSINPWPGGK
jgi:hypothetical protein